MTHAYSTPRILSQTGWMTIEGSSVRFLSLRSYQSFFSGPNARRLDVIARLLNDMQTAQCLIVPAILLRMIDLGLLLRARWD